MIYNYGIQDLLHCLAIKQGGFPYQISKSIHELDPDYWKGRPIGD